MTREDFERLDTFDEIIAEAREHDYEWGDDLIHPENLDERICADITEEMQHSYWYNIKEYLNEIEDDGNCYRRDGRFEYTVMYDGDDYFDDYKRELYDWLADNGYFDDDEEELVEELEEEDDNPPFVVGADLARDPEDEVFQPEEITVDFLRSTGSAPLQHI